MLAMEGAAMEQQPVMRRLSVYVTSIALVVSAAGLARTLFRVLSPATRSRRVGARGVSGREEAIDESRDKSCASPKSGSSTKSEATVGGTYQGSQTGLFLAAVVGVAIGAGVALLCAPQSGNQSREWIARRTRWQD